MRRGKRRRKKRGVKHFAREKSGDAKTHGMKQTTKIADLKDGDITNVVGRLEHKRVKDLDNPDLQLLINLTVRDETGSIRCFGFKEFKAISDTLQEGVTFLFKDVLVKKNPRDDGVLEIRMNERVSVQKTTPIELATEYTAIGDAQPSSVCNLRCVVARVDEEIVRMGNGQDSYKVVLKDAAEGDIGASFTDKAFFEVQEGRVKAGSVITCRARISAKQYAFVEEAPQLVEDDALRAIFDACDDAERPAAKRQRVVFATISDVEATGVRSHGTLTAVVASTGTAVTQPKPNLCKFEMTLVDQTMQSIDLAVMKEPGASRALAEVEVGDVVTADVYVSEYGGMSLIADEVKKEDAPALREWWKEHAHDAFTNVGQRHVQSQASSPGSLSAS